MNESSRKTNYRIASLLFYISAIILTVMIGGNFYQYISLIVGILILETAIYLFTISLINYLYRDN